MRKLFLFFGLVALLSASCLFLFIENIPGHKELDSLLMRRLTRNQPAVSVSQDLASRSDNVAYVLGGSADSLVAKFQTTAELYHQGLFDKILILSTPGYGQYDPLLQRNLSNDEWAFSELVKLGVKRIDIEAVSFQKELLGTFTEAEGIESLAAIRGYQRIILITSQYHTARTWLTFSGAMKGQNTTLFIYGSSDDTDLLGHLVEYLKLLLYQNFVMPIHSFQIPARKSGSANSQYTAGTIPVNCKYIGKGV